METKARASLGTQGIWRPSSQIGVAYVAIPEDQDRDEYMSNCYKTSTLMIRDESGSSMKNVFFSKEVMGSIEFPETSGERGTCVIYAYVPKHNYPVIVGTLDLKNIFPTITSQDQFRMQRKNTKNLVDFSALAQSSTMSLSVSSGEEGKGKLSINVVNPDQTAEIDVYVKGTARIFADKQVTVGANDELILTITKPDQTLLGKIQYKAGEGLTLTDEFDNSILLRDKTVSIKEGSNGLLINIDDSRVHLGSMTAAQATLLGETTKDKLDRLITLITQITVPTSMGPSGVPSNNVQLLQLKEELDTILSTKVKSD